jgi:hypothetical protein
VRISQRRVRHTGTPATCNYHARKAEFTIIEIRGFSAPVLRGLAGKPASCCEHAIARGCLSLRHLSPEIIVRSNPINKKRRPHKVEASWKVWLKLLMDLAQASQAQALVDWQEHQQVLVLSASLEHQVPV